jgi:hypothetical protein
MDGCQHGPHRDLHAWLHQELLDHPVLEDFDLDDALVRFHLGNDVTVLDAVAGLDMPHYQRPDLHISTQTGHAELSHGSAPFS